MFDSVWRYLEVQNRYLVVASVPWNSAERTNLSTCTILYTVLYRSHKVEE